MCSWNLNRLACKKCNSAKEEINKFVKETENINVWGKGKCPSDMLLKKKKKKNELTDEIICTSHLPSSMAALQNISRVYEAIWNTPKNR